MKFLPKIFKLFNKLFTVPIFRLGLGSFMGNPITGYIMVIKNIGRKSGKTYFTPVNYTIMNGYVYCMAGFGKNSHWYLNLKANPFVELMLPSGPIAGMAEEATDPEECLEALRQILINAGFAGYLEGYNPRNPPEERLQKTLEKAPLIRIRQTGIGSGASDSSGWMWITMTILTVVVLWLIFK